MRSRSTTPSSSACSSRNSEGNSVVSRRRIRVEESLLCTDTASSFLPKDASISRRCHAVSRLTKDRWGTQGLWAAKDRRYFSLGLLQTYSVNVSCRSQLNRNRGCRFIVGAKSGNAGSESVVLSNRVIYFWRDHVTVVLTTLVKSYFLPPRSAARVQSFSANSGNQSSKRDSGWACLTSSRLITELGTLGWVII